MLKNKGLLEIELISFLTKGVSNQIIQGAKFKNELKPKDYGIQRFISQTGEVAVMDLLTDGFPVGYDNIRDTLLRVIEKRKQANKSLGIIMVGINDVVRYFADLSPQGYMWYWEYMKLLDPVLMNECEEINRESVVSRNEEITFLRWLSLTNNKKEKYMEYFLDNQISGRERISKYIYDVDPN